MATRHPDRTWSGGAAIGWSAFESFAAATHVLSGDGLVVEANPAFEQLFGAPRAALLGRTQADLCDGGGAERRRLAGRILREAASRGSWQGRLAARGCDGRRFTTEALVYPALVDGRRYFICIQEEAPGAPGAGAPGARAWLEAGLASPG